MERRVHIAGEEKFDWQEEEKEGKWKVLSSSWGISLVVHLVLVLILMSIYWLSPVKKKVRLIEGRPEKIEEILDETLPPSLKTVPQKMESKVVVDNPVKTTQPVKKPKPQGLSLDNQTDRNLEQRALDTNAGLGGAPAGAYGQRSNKGKWSRNGATPQCQNALELALEWLRRHQSPQGYWESGPFTNHCDRGVCKNERPMYRGNNAYTRHGCGNKSHRVGVTSLALLAFLGDGHTHQRGKYRKVVRKGLRWLKSLQVNNPTEKWHGSIGLYVPGVQTKTEWVYCHALTTMVFCEAFAMTKDFALKPYAQRAVDFVVKCQNPYLAWRYSSRSKYNAIKSGENDTSVTGWMILALKAGKAAGPVEDGGLDVPQHSFDQAMNFIHRVTSSHGITGYMSPGGSSSAMRTGRQFTALPVMTSVGVLCRLFAGEAKSNAMIQRGIGIMRTHLPEWENNIHKDNNHYYWYYGTYAMFQHGGRPWKEWNKAMQKALLASQRRGVGRGTTEKRAGNCEVGSWDPCGPWGIAGGRVYATAISALTLEIYFRYQRVAKKGKN